jgi:hypothetical protein
MPERANDYALTLAAALIKPWTLSLGNSLSLTEERLLTAIAP